MRLRIAVCIVAAGLALIAMGNWNNAARKLDEERRFIANASTHSETDETRASVEIPQDADSVQKVSVRVSVVSFTVISSKAPFRLRKFEERFDSALARFNSAANSSSKDFAKSQEFAALVEEFRSQGKITFYDEIQEVVVSGQYHEWGEANWIRVEPGDLDGCLSVSISAKFGGSQVATSILVGPVIVNVGGSTTCSTETNSVAVPILSEIPVLGPKLFTIPQTPTTGKYEQFLLSAALVK